MTIFVAFLNYWSGFEVYNTAHSSLIMNWSWTRQGGGRYIGFVRLDQGTVHRVLKVVKYFVFWNQNKLFGDCWTSSDMKLYCLGGQKNTTNSVLPLLLSTLG